MSKTPSRSELLKAQIQEQARATEVANQKNNALQQKVDKLEEQLANEKAERERILEEKLLQIQEEENNKRQALREDIMKEMLSKFAEQRETPLLQVKAIWIFVTQISILECVLSLNYFHLFFLCRLTQGASSQVMLRQQLRKMLANIELVQCLEVFFKIAKATMLQEHILVHGNY